MYGVNSGFDINTGIASGAIGGSLIWLSEGLLMMVCGFAVLSLFGVAKVLTNRAKKRSV